MVALLLLVQGDSGMLATQKKERVKKSREEKIMNKVCIFLLYCKGTGLVFKYTVQVINSHTHM